MAFKSYFEARVLGGLLELEEYLKATEKYLLDVSTGREAWLDEQAEALRPEERNEFYERNIDFHRIYAEIFPRILRNSFLVSVHSLLEHKMDFVCKRIKEERQISISWSDLKGNEPERFKLYCRLANLGFPFNDSAWQQIKYYSMVRNCIVHTNGLLAEFQCKGKRGFITYLTDWGIISQKQEIELTPKFCEDVIKTIRVFLNKVIEVYELDRKRQKQVS
jgi:hypothetical protein